MRLTSQLKIAKRFQMIFIRYLLLWRLQGLSLWICSFSPSQENSKSGWFFRRTKNDDLQWTDWPPHQLTNSLHSIILNWIRQDAATFLEYDEFQNMHIWKYYSVTYSLWVSQSHNVVSDFCHRVIKQFASSSSSQLLSHKIKLKIKNKFYDNTSDDLL